MSVVGLDIGGANLKAADLRGRTRHRPFALWRTPERLSTEVRDLLADFPGVSRVAVTMTGELCDCFATKSDGVRHILASVREATPCPVRVYTLDGVFVADVSNAPLSAAASNWLALANYVGGHHARDALLIDLGSTTCDIIPIVGGVSAARGRTDPERLASGELVYCGVRRTPLCAVFGFEAAAELFATMEDVYVTLGELPEDENRRDTADGRPVTKRHAAARLARMRCDEAWTTDQATAFALEARDRQISWLARAVSRVAMATAVLAGEGEFLLRDILTLAAPGTKLVSLAEALPPGVSAAACAYAVAVLAEGDR